MGVVSDSRGGVVWVLFLALVGGCLGGYFLLGSKASEWLLSRGCFGGAQVLGEGMFRVVLLILVEGLFRG